MVGTPFSQELVFNFQKRRDQIMENDTMLNVMFCDPCYIFQMTSEERKMARGRLSNLYVRLKSTSIIIIIRSSGVVSSGGGGVRPSQGVTTSQSAISLCRFLIEP